MTNDELNPNDETGIVGRLCQRPWRLVLRHSFLIISDHCPSGVVTSVPGGGLNSKVEAGTGARVWFEYVVTIRSPFGSNISVRSTRRLSLIRRSSF
jgi:hypothetical protein